MNEWKLSLMLCVNNGKRKKEREREGKVEKEEEEDKKPIRMDSRAVCLIWSSAVRILSQVAVSMSVKRAHENDTREMVKEKNGDFFKRPQLYSFSDKEDRTNQSPYIRSSIRCVRCLFNHWDHFTCLRYCGCCC